MSKTVKILFTVSVALNILLAGVILGHFSERYGRHREFRKEMMRTVEELPPEKRKLITETMRDLKKETRDARRKMRDDRRKIIETLTAPEFDPERFDRDVEELNGSITVLSKELAASVRKVAVKLDRDERMALAAFIEKGHRTRRPGPGPGGPPPDGFEEPAN